MRTIHKYPIELLIEVQKIVMPLGGKILKLGKQGRGHFIWVEVDTDSATGYRMIRMYGTGWDFEERTQAQKEAVYIDSVFVPDSCGGPDIYVWHFYDEGYL